MINHAQGAPASIIHPETTDHPDFALTLVWEGYKAVWKEEEKLIDVGLDGTERAAALYQLSVKYRDLIEKLPAVTPTGIAIKLKYLFIYHNENRWAELAILEGAPVDEDEMDLTNEMILDLIDDAENMGGVA